MRSERYRFSKVKPYRCSKSMEPSPFSTIKVLLPSFIPSEVKQEIKDLLTPIAERFKTDLMVAEANPSEGVGLAKCPFCGKKFTDVWARRAYNRLNQHIHDKHLEAIQTPPNHEVGG
jgi:hypothetical protein